MRKNWYTHIRFEFEYTVKNIEKRGLRKAEEWCSEGGGVGTLASACALHPLYEGVPYFRDRGGEL